MLLCNLKLNYCDNVNVDYIGLALGNKDSIAYPCMEYGKDNLGATYLHPEPIDPKTNDQSLILDPVQVVSGDSIFENIHVDFIKMDVESMEIVALDGLSKTVANSRPKMFVEVVDTNKEEFLNWVELNNYKIHSVHDKFSKGIYANYMIIPNE